MVETAGTFGGAGAGGPAGPWGPHPAPSGFEQHVSLPTPLRGEETRGVRASADVRQRWAPSVRPGARSRYGTLKSWRPRLSQRSSVQSWAR